MQSKSLKNAINESLKPILHKQTIYLPMPVYRKLKIKAATEGTTLSEILTVLAVKCLDGEQAKRQDG